jgi:tRNA-splicing ligase RtcB
LTRKGAIRARQGDFGVIPGSMGTSSYIVRGLGNPASYESCSHGAGRRMSRSRARKEIALDDFVASMGGRDWQVGRADQLLDEAPQAYKDIDQVMADQADLVAVEHTLHQILNYKGTT